MSEIIAIANHKGGVGKTTTTANLGAALALLGKRVLLVDMDAQANLSSSLMNEADIEQTIYDSMKDGAPLPIHRISPNLSLIPAAIELSRIDLDLADRENPHLTIKKLLTPFGRKYDYILLDCPPSIGFITVNALTAANGVLITMSAEALPLRGLERLNGIIEEIAHTVNPTLHLSGIVITKYNRRKLNNIVIDAIREQYGEKVLNTKIRENISLAEAPLTHSSIFDYDPESNGANDYMELAKEVNNITSKQ